MAGPEFFQTQMGRRFFESQLPNLTKAINRLADVKEAELVLEKEKLENARKYNTDKVYEEICEALRRYEKEDSSPGNINNLYATLYMIREHWTDIVGK